ncbi:sugar ABC transporter permease [Roseomonas sp. OT10]|uniref:carbohydrate ABC transporter permease n=1 Tax=Roseomonas cutis TaxID=2897332 RepID=UPI001E460453|nr:sugar ABC transporter permease [Roseomonas sp. OT10]UFN49277.1 sugar ABC transporter permease [Roseomonas sp. OT10]
MLDRDRGLGYLLLTPTVLLLALLLGWPLVQAVMLSFYEMHPLTRRLVYVGLENYQDIFGDEMFWQALANNFIWLAGSLILQIGGGVAVALLLHRSFLGRGLARSLILFPYLMPVLVAALVWQWMLHDTNGIVNVLWQGIGLPRVDWFGAMPNAMITVIVVGSWRAFPFVVIAVLARLQSIPAQLYEAAELDGASRWSRFWDITMTQLAGVLSVVTLLRAVWDFREFDLIFLMTGGGPVIGTTTLPLLVYKEGFELFAMGRALAIAVVMLLCMLVLIGLYFRALRRMPSAEEADS